MSILDKYAREPAGERRTKAAGTKLEPTLYENFVKHCEARGLTTSEALRYLVIELLKDQKETMVNQTEYNNNEKLTMVNQKKPKLTGEQFDEWFDQKVQQTTEEIKKAQEFSKEIISKHEKEATTISEKEEENPQEPTEVNHGKPKGTQRNLQQWTVNNLLPCPAPNCEKWYTTKNYARHIKKHGFNNGYEIIQAYLEKAEQMIKERRESEQ
jgi:hypothetical protein